MKKTIKVIISILLLSIVSSVAVLAEDEVNTPYCSYTFTEDYTKTVMTPAPYVEEQTIDGNNLGIGSFNGLSDVTYDSATGMTYLSDSGNNRIVVLDKNRNLNYVFDSFENAGKRDGFKNPNTVFIKDNAIYVSDTDNCRILIFDKTNYSLVKTINQPEIKILGDYTFLPESFAVDLAGRIYVIVRNVNKGVVQLDADGNFERFVGAPDVTLTFAQRLWRTIMNDTQKSQLEKAVPAEYNSIKIDKDGFLYLTTQDATINAITKLNCSGDDILTVDTLFAPDGDTVYYENKGQKKSSYFVDISVREDGIYAALDSSKGRIFVYNQEGVLLYCFGGSGNQKGLFQSPSALEIYGERLFVTDRKANILTVFTETAFGKTVDSAVTAMLDGKYEESAGYWNKVIEMCPSYDYAFKSLAKSDIQAKEYTEALKKLKGDPDYTYYYKAFEGARKNFISDNFTLIFSGVFAVIILAVILRRLWKKFGVNEKLNKYRLYKELKFSNYVMLHPIDGFWDLKREKRGSLKAANILVILFIVLYGARAQLTGYCFTHQRFKEIDVIFETAMMVLPLASWIVSNWCFTSLMDGEGSFKDIYIATAYALKPYIITAVPMLVLSHCLSGNEAFIYNTFDGIIMIWMLGLIYFGMMVTHNYSMGKGILTAVLTLIGICLMMFLILVCFNIGQDISSFSSDIYTEITYRMY